MAGEESIVYKYEYVRLLFTNIWPRNQTYCIPLHLHLLGFGITFTYMYYISVADYSELDSTYVQLYIVDQKNCNFLQNLKLSTPHIN